jgi:ABC-type lipoprotein release transport system permease subunit
MARQPAPRRALPRPRVFAAITLTVAAIALATSWIPARRASRIDPMVALRDE